MDFILQITSIPSTKDNLIGQKQGTITDSLGKLYFQIMFVRDVQIQIIWPIPIPQNYNDTTSALEGNVLGSVIMWLKSGEHLDKILHHVLCFIIWIF